MATRSSSLCSSRSGTGLGLLAWRPCCTYTRSVHPARPLMNGARAAPEEQELAKGVGQHRYAPVAAYQAPVAWSYSTRLEQQEPSARTAPAPRGASRFRLGSRRPADAARSATIFPRLCTARAERRRSSTPSRPPVQACGPQGTGKQQDADLLDESGAVGGRCDLGRRTAISAGGTFHTGPG